MATAIKRKRVVKSENIPHFRIEPVLKGEYYAALEHFNLTTTDHLTTKIRELVAAHKKESRRM